MENLTMHDIIGLSFAVIYELGLMKKAMLKKRSTIAKKKDRLINIIRDRQFRSKACDYLMFSDDNVKVEATSRVIAKKRFSKKEPNTRKFREAVHGSDKNLHKLQSKVKRKPSAHYFQSSDINVKVETSQRVIKKKRFAKVEPKVFKNRKVEGDLNKRLQNIVKGFFKTKNKHHNGPCLKSLNNDNQEEETNNHLNRTLTDMMLIRFYTVFYESTLRKMAICQFNHGQNVETCSSHNLLGNMNCIKPVKGEQHLIVCVNKEIEKINSSRISNINESLKFRLLKSVDILVFVIEKELDGYQYLLFEIENKDTSGVNYIINTSTEMIENGQGMLVKQTFFFNGIFMVLRNASSEIMFIVNKSLSSNEGCNEIIAYEPFHRIQKEQEHFKQSIVPSYYKKILISIDQGNVGRNELLAGKPFYEMQKEKEHFKQSIVLRYYKNILISIDQTNGDCNELLAYKPFHKMQKDEDFKQIIVQGYYRKILNSIDQTIGCCNELLAYKLYNEIQKGEVFKQIIVPKYCKQIFFSIDQANVCCNELLVYKPFYEMQKEDFKQIVPRSYKKILITIDQASVGCNELLAYKPFHVIQKEEHFKQSIVLRYCNKNFNSIYQKNVGCNQVLAYKPFHEIQKQEDNFKHSLVPRYYQRTLLSVDETNYNKLELSAILVEMVHFLKILEYVRVDTFYLDAKGGTRHGSEEQRGDRRFNPRTPEGWVANSLRARPNNSGGQPHNTASPTAGLYTSSPRGGADPPGNPERRVSMRLHRGANASTLDLAPGPPRNPSDKANPVAEAVAPTRTRPAAPNEGTPRKK